MERRPMRLLAATIAGARHGHGMQGMDGMQDMDGIDRMRKACSGHDERTTS